MDSLWLAILLYSLGLAVVLHWRPRAMFHENGTWKEFGYQRDSRHTLFPFWLFAVAWAFVSYAAATAAVWIIDSGAGTAAAMASASASAGLTALEYDGHNVSNASSAFPEEEEGAGSEEDDDVATPVSRMSSVSPLSGVRPSLMSTPASGRRKPRPGYYVLDPSSRKSGLRRYIFYGAEKP